MPELFGTIATDLNDKTIARIFSYLNKDDLIAARFCNKSWLAAVQDFLQRRRVYTDVLQKCAVFKEVSLDGFDCKQLSGGLTNLTFLIKAKTHKYVVRLPGAETSLFINRRDEYINAILASQTGVNPSIIYYDQEYGAQITTYLKKPFPMSQQRLQDDYSLKAAVAALKKIHGSGGSFANDIDVFERNKKMLGILSDRGITLPAEYANVAEKMNDLSALFSRLNPKKVPCHNDTTPPNFILSNNKMFLIDWEYSGNNYAIWDLVCLSMEASFSPDQVRKMLQEYYGQISSDVQHTFILLAPVYEYWVSIWALVQMAKEHNIERINELRLMEEKRIEHCQTLLNSPEFSTAIKYFLAASLKPTTPLPQENVRFFASARQETINVRQYHSISDQNYFGKMTKPR